MSPSPVCSHFVAVLALSAYETKGSMSDTSTVHPAYTVTNGDEVTARANEGRLDPEHKPFVALFAGAASGTATLVAVEERCDITHTQS